MISDPEFEAEMKRMQYALVGFLLGAVLIMFIRLSSDTRDVLRCQETLPEGEPCVIAAVPAYTLADRDRDQHD
jgi:hypothetical protein